MSVAFLIKEDLFLIRYQFSTHCNTFHQKEPARKTHKKDQKNEDVFDKTAC